MQEEIKPPTASVPIVVDSLGPDDAHPAFEGVYQLQFGLPRAKRRELMSNLLNTASGTSNKAIRAALAIAKFQELDLQAVDIICRNTAALLGQQRQQEPEAAITPEDIADAQRFLAAPEVDDPIPQPNRGPRIAQPVEDGDWVEVKEVG